MCPELIGIRFCRVPHFWREDREERHPFFLVCPLVSRPVSFGGPPETPAIFGRAPAPQFFSNATLSPDFPLTQHHMQGSSCLYFGVGPSKEIVEEVGDFPSAFIFERIWVEMDEGEDKGCCHECEKMGGVAETHVCCCPTYCDPFF